MTASGRPATSVRSGAPRTTRYRFYYGWKNVKAMGELAAHNMTGGKAPFQTFLEETLTVDEQGRLHSSFWDYD